MIEHAVAAGGISFIKLLALQQLYGKFPEVIHKYEILEYAHDEDAAFLGEGLGILLLQCKEMSVADKECTVKLLGDRLVEALADLPLLHAVPVQLQIIHELLLVIAAHGSREIVEHLTSGKYIYSF